MSLVTCSESNSAKMTWPFVRPISPFEFAKCFNLTDTLTYRLSHASNLYSLDCAVPAHTSAICRSLPSMS
jgi:hypothetical protein